MAAFAAFAVGLVFARESGLVARSAWFFAAAGGLGLLAIPLPRRASIAALFAAAVTLGAGWWCYRMTDARPLDVAGIFARLNSESNHRGTPVTLEGIVLENPAIPRPAAVELGRFRPETKRWRFAIGADRIDPGSLPESLAEALDASEVSKRSVPRTPTSLKLPSSRVWVSVGGAAAPACRAGDRVRITGLASSFDPPLNPGETDIRLIAAERGWAGSLTCTDASLIQPVGDPGDVAAKAFLRFRAKLQSRAERAISAAAGDPDGAASADPKVRSLLRGLVLGAQDSESGELFDIWARIGLAHVLSISGFHLAVLAGFSLFLLRLTGDRGWLEPALVALCIALYLVILPADSPIIRSAAMVFILLVAEASGRRYDRLTLLIWIGLGLLVWRPLELWSLGYQLSLGLTALLMWTTATFRDAVFGEEVRTDVPRLDGLRHILHRWISTAISGGVACGLASVPVVVFRNGIISPLGLPATLLITPVVTLVLWIAYAALLVGMVWPRAAEFAAPLLDFTARAALRLAEFIESVPGAWSRLPSLGPESSPAAIAWVFAATATLVAFTRWAGWRRRVWWIALAAMLAFTALLWSRNSSARTPLRIDVLAVDNGSCIIVRSGSEALLWDCGSLGSGNSRRVREIIRSARTLGVWRVPTAIITHPDIDHFGLMPEVSEQLGVQRVLVPPRFIQQAEREPAGPAAAMLDCLRRRGIDFGVLTSGDAFELGAARVEVLSPPAGADWSNDNDHSLVARFAVRTAAGEQSVLLTGDVQAAAIGSLRERHPQLAADITEAPHHGSALPASIDWLRTLNPVVVHQSTGIERADDERWAFLRQRLIWSTTATDGAGWSEITPDGSIRTGSRLRSPLAVPPRRYHSP